MSTMFYRRPSRIRAIVDSVIKALIVRVGLGTGGSRADPLRVLRVRGRTTGQPRDVPIRVAIIEGQRYVVSMLGEAGWVRNLRASGRAELVIGTEVEPVTAREIHGAEKTGFLAQYLVHPAFRTSARSAFHVDTNRLTPPAIDLVATRHPVFLLLPEVTTR